MENTDPQILPAGITTATEAMLQPKFMEVNVAVLQSWCPSCLQSFTSHRDFPSFTVWEGQPIARRLADQERTIAELQRKNADQERKNADQERTNADQERKNADQERAIINLKKQMEYLLESDRRRASATKSVKRQIARHINDFVIQKRLFDDGESLLSEVDATVNRHATEAVSSSPGLRCDELDLNDVVNLLDSYFEPIPLGDFLGLHKMATTAAPSNA